MMLDKVKLHLVMLWNFYGFQGPSSQWSESNGEEKDPIAAVLKDVA